MKGKTLILCILVFLILSGILVFAREDKGVDRILARMKTQLNLTSEQAVAVEPIIREYADRRQQIMQTPKTILTPGKRSIRSQLKQLKEEEDNDLSQVLTPDQMKKWDQGENVKDFLNQDDAGGADKTPQAGGIGF